MAPQILFLVLLSAFPLSLCQFSSPQNIQTTYPFPLPPLGQPPPSPQTNSTSPPPPPPPPPPAATPAPPLQPPKSSSKGTVAKAIGVTAASTLVLSAVFFFLLFLMFSRRKKETPPNPYSYSRSKLGAPREFMTRFSSKLKGVIVDEDGLDVLYWRNLQGETVKDSFGREVFDKKEDKRVISPEERRQKLQLGLQEVPLPLPREKSSSSHQFWAQGETRNHPQPVLAVPNKKSGAPPPPPPPIPSKKSPPSPPPPPQKEISSKSRTGESSNTGGDGNLMNPIASSLSTQAISRSPPPPPPIQSKKSPPSPPPPPKEIPSKNRTGESSNTRGDGNLMNPGLSTQAISRSSPTPPPPEAPPPLPVLPVPKKKSGAQPPPPPKGVPSKNRTGESSGVGGEGNDKVKLKPLHWDKVNRNVNHSNVWDKIEGGSFRFDDDLMEALFGNVATSRKSPRTKGNPLSPNSGKPNPSSPVFILDPRKSQNTAIVIRSLAISRKEIVDALMEGHGLDNDTLEKLTKIAPTEEEESQIVAYDGDPTRLADAESFLYHLLRIVPTAFTRFKALLFRSNYDSEILNQKELLHTLEMGCKELRTRGLFLKLLEAILKAGNRMNAGTARGDAQGFSLSSLRKLSDVKSTDGKTTLLHFVVEGVVRAEGKRCAANANQSLNRGIGNTRVQEDSTTEEDLEREYKSLGLPIVGGLSAEFSNVKKAATIDYDSFAKSSFIIEAQIAELVQALTPFGYTDGGSFLREMKSFLGEAALQVKEVKEEQTSVMALVKRTTEYYQPGTSKDKEKHPLQLFVIVKDFLDAVDQACVDISRDLQKRRKSATTNVGPSPSSSSPPESTAPRNSVRFPMLPDHFLSDKSKSSSSDSDDD